MTPKVTRQIVGYDPATEAVAFERYIPIEKWSDVLSLIQNSNDDPNHLYNYPLDVSTANDILAIVGGPAVQNLSYFLEVETAG